MTEQEEARRAYRERAQELRSLAARLKHPENESALIAMALQYERLAVHELVDLETPAGVGATGPIPQPIAAPAPDATLLSSAS